MGAAVVVVVVLVVVAGVAGYVVLYNSLVRDVNRTEAGWGQVQVQLERRHDLVPNLVETVKGYAAHESGTLAAVVAARGAALSATSPADAAAADDALSGALVKLFALAESYPELKASANFVELQRELSATEDKVAAARQQYNASVLSLNTRCETFPSNLVAGSRPRFARREYFSVPDEATSAAPTVKF